MAKRKRLTPPRPDLLAAPALETRGLTRAPIAHVAADAATMAAIDELSRELESAREEGRLVISLPLELVRADHLERDRIEAESEALAALMESIRARGQQQPVEVQALPDGSYGLISGWRRLLALQHLHAETGDARFSRIQALLRRPEDQAQAYVAMVEENEMRADLSYFERARIVRRAVATGVFDGEKQALKRLFSGASYAKRSKIKSFLPVVDALDGVLRFPARIPERTGLKLAKALAADPGVADRLRSALIDRPPQSPEEESRLLMREIAPQKQSLTGTSETESLGSSGAESREVSPGLRMSAEPGRVVIEGPGVNAGLIDRLQTWLRSQG